MVLQRPLRRAGLRLTYGARCRSLALTADSKSRVKEGAASPIKSSRPAQPLPKASAGPFDQKPKAAAAAPLKEPVPSRSHHPGPTPEALCNHGAHARLRRGDQRTFPARMCLTRSKTNVASSVLPAQYAAPTKAAPATYYDTASGVSSV